MLITTYILSIEFWSVCVGLQFKELFHIVGGDLPIIWLDPMEQGLMEDSLDLKESIKPNSFTPSSAFHNSTTLSLISMLTHQSKFVHPRTFNTFNVNRILSILLCQWVFHKIVMNLPATINCRITNFVSLIVFVHLVGIYTLLHFKKVYDICTDSI